MRQREPHFRRAFGSAWRVLRRNFWTFLAWMLFVQFLLAAVILPSLGWLYSWFLGVGRIDGISQENFGVILGNPGALLILVGFATVAMFFIYAELAVFTILASRALSGEPMGVRAVAGELAHRGRKLLSWQALFFVLYAALLIPLSGLGLASALTEHIAIPQFITGELLKTTSGAVIYGVFLVVILYLALRLIFTTSVFVSSDDSILRSMRRSISLSRRVQGRLVGGFAILSAGAAAVMLALGLVLAIPVALSETVFESDNTIVAGVALAIVSMAKPLVLGCVAVLVAGFVVALQRSLEGVQIADIPRRAPSRRARLGIVAIVSASALLMGPLVVAYSYILTLNQSVSHTQIIAHRGDMTGGVENSIEALRAASAADADYVELDIQETRDAHFVVLHDTNLRRLAGVDKNVYDLDLGQLEQTTIRQGEFASTIPSFAEFAGVANELGMKLLVEVKPHGHEKPGFEQRVNAALAVVDPQNQYIVQSIDKEVIERIKADAPDRAAAYVISLQLGRLPETTADVVVIEDWSFADSMLLEAKDRGVRVFVWTVDDPTLIRDYLRRGVDGIITDQVSTAVVSRELQDRGTSSITTRYLEEFTRELGG